jgi:hypothetical protein
MKQVIAITILLGLLLSGGCATRRSAAARTLTGADGKPILVVELDSLTQSLADGLVGELYSVCDELKKDNSDPGQRHEAQLLLTDFASNVYDIAGNADAFTRVLDLLAITKVVGQVWIDEKKAVATFGERSGLLVRALVRCREEATELASRLLKPTQLKAFDSLLKGWRQDYPEFTRPSFVRFSQFARARNHSPAFDVVAPGGLFANVGKAGAEVEETRLLGERVFYLLKRAPTLLRWQALTIKDDLLATPELATTLDDAHRLTGQIEQLPSNVVAVVNASLQRLDGTVTNVRPALAEANTLAAAVQSTSQSFEQLLKAAGILYERFKDRDTTKTRTDSRPFDIREYTRAFQELDDSAETLHEILSTTLSESPKGARLLQEVNKSLDGRLAFASAQIEALLDSFFCRVYLALGLLFVVLIVYKMTSLLLRRRVGREERVNRDR